MQDIVMTEVVKVCEWGKTDSFYISPQFLKVWALPLPHPKTPVLFFFFKNVNFLNHFHLSRHRTSLRLWICPDFICFSKEELKNVSFSGPLLDNLVHSYYHLISKIKL